MSGLFLNPLIADNESFVLKRGNLLRHVRVQLSQKLKIFCDFFFTFYKFRFNLQDFQKKDDATS